VKNEELLLAVTEDRNILPNKMKKV